MIQIHQSHSTQVVANQERRTVLPPKQATWRQTTLHPWSSTKPLPKPYQTGIKPRRLQSRTPQQVRNI
jgi:hypothetical protein